MAHSECDEVAQNLFGSLTNEQRFQMTGLDVETLRPFVKAQMGDETHTIIDNVTVSLSRLLKARRH